MMKMLRCRNLPSVVPEKGGVGAAVFNGKLFVVGGIPGKSCQYLDLKDVREGWKRIPDLLKKRSLLGLAVGDGKLFAVGGSYKDTHKSVEYLDLKSIGAGWKRLPDMLTARHMFGVAVWGDKLFAVGGYHTRPQSEYLDLKDIRAGWKKLPDMLTKRERFGCAVWDGKLMVIGGRMKMLRHCTSGEYLDCNDIGAGWRQLPNMQTERAEFGFGVWDDKLLAVGGEKHKPSPPRQKTGEYLDLKNIGAGWKKLPDIGTTSRGSSFGFVVWDNKLLVVEGMGSFSSGPLFSYPHDQADEMRAECLDLKILNFALKNLNY
mmetsp:Transcript_11901/g.23893  ORF Transcript_11901/g.23893 Transcript_11901/m.23893 type:complete len:317 (+) Transcript_11901:286-1236(+)